MRSLNCRNSITTRHNPDFLVPILILTMLLLIVIIIPCSAIEPAWTFTYGDREMNDIAIAPDGSSIVAATGKVLLLARNGTVIANEPYGEILSQSRDGSTIVSAYSSVVASTVYVFMRKTDRNGTISFQKLWETTLPDRVFSTAVSDDGEIIAISAGGKGTHLFSRDSGRRMGYSEKYSALVAISPRGRTIAGISLTEGLRIFNYQGTLLKKYEMNMPGNPRSFFMNSNGTVLVFDAGPHIIAFNISNGSEFWRIRTSGDIIMLAMTPSGDAYTRKELEQMATHAGFQKHEFHPMPPSPHAVLISTK